MIDLPKLLALIFGRADRAVPPAREILLAENGDPAREAQFYESIHLGDSLTKKTLANRLRGLDEWLLPQLPEDGNLRILDLGISSGLTTAELSAALAAKNIAHGITAVDRYITAYLLIVNRGESVLIDAAGRPLHFEFGGRGFGYSLGRDPRVRWGVWGLKNFARSWAARHGGKLKELDDAEKVGGFMVHPVRMLCRATRNNSLIEVVEADIFDEKFWEARPQKFDLIRAANLLNPLSFSEDKIKFALKHIRRSIDENGLLLLARTEKDGTTNGTLFRLNGDSLQVAARYGGGSELEPLVSEC